MTRQEIIREAQRLERKIQDIKEFIKILENDNAVSSVEGSAIGLGIIKRTIKTSFLGFWSRTKRVEIEVPYRIIPEIVVECRVWIKKLESKADKLLKIA